MKKVLLLTLLLAMITSIGFAQSDKFWSVYKESLSNIVKDKAVSRISYPKTFKLFNLNTASLRQDLFEIVGNNRNRQTTVISLPNADGEIEEYEMVEASNFDPELQASFPEIRAYSGRGITDKYATLKLSISPQGIQGMIFRTEKENEFIEPYSKDHLVYAVFRSERERGKLPWVCTTQDKEMASGIVSQIGAQQFAAGSSAGTLKTLRLAQSCNGEYANYFGATSSAQVGLVLAAYNNTLTRCNGCYEKDFALHLNLIANTTAVIYYNPATDPYTTLSSWNKQLQQTLTSIIGSANYDIGHMFGASGGGGNAGCIGCVCVNPSGSSSLAKGSGITSPADGIPEGDNFDIDYVAHEVGHQLGANHTFSMSLEGTGQNKEVGSGITIMGYAGITSQDVARHSIDIFHETSIAQVQANLASKSCPVTTNITANNAIPVIGPVSNYTIPISTPFALTATATDANGDPLTYCWEQNDNSTTSGTSSVASPTKTTGPNWLSFSPTASPTRTFPILSTILAGGFVTGPLPGGDAGANIEALSSVSRTLNFRLTVRDNHPFSSSAPVAVGQTAFTDVVVTVTNTSGPFQVTSPNTNITWNAGSSATVTWSVNGTNAGSVNCASVKISLSTDGGNTFPIVLAASTPNDGSETITVPNTPGSNNRIKVEAVGNIFFDISNSNFVIGGAAACGNPAGLASSAISENGATVSWSAVSGAVSYTVDYKAASSGTWINAATATSSLSVGLTGLSAGTLYDWRVKTNCASSASNYSSAQFTTSTPAGCNPPAGLSSTAITQTAATVSWSAVSGASGYSVDYKEASAGTWTSAATNTSGLSVNLTGLTAATLYDWRVRSICSSSNSNYSNAQFTTASASSPCPGVYDVSTNGTLSGAAQIPLNTEVKGTISSKSDVDYYQFVVTNGGTITLSLTTLPANYDLALLNSSGSQLAISQNNGTNDETITGTIAAGTYYARVAPKGNASNASSCYTLTVGDGTASRNANEEVFSIKVFPNPAKSFINVILPAFEGTATINMVDVYGRTIVQKNTTQQNNQVSVAGLPLGVYMIKATSTGKNLGTDKFIKE